MFDLFYMGGPLFMGTLTIIFICMIAVAGVNSISLFKGDMDDKATAARKLAYIKSVGLFALIIGILGQLIGLFSAFEAIESMNVDVSPSLLAGGFKVSMITTLYGMVIYAISILIWFGLSVVLKRQFDRDR